MRMNKKTLARVALVSGALFALPALHAVGAEDYPSRPVTIVVPFPPGASNDILGRYEADVLGRALHGSFGIRLRTLGLLEVFQADVAALKKCFCPTKSLDRGLQFDFCPAQLRLGLDDLGFGRL